MAIKDHLTNPWIIAGAAGGAYVGHSKYGKKHGYYAAAGGALAGALAGYLVNRLVGGPQPAPAQVNAPAAGQGEYLPDPLGEFVDLDGPDMTGLHHAAPSLQRAVNNKQRAEAEAQAVANEDLGSLTGANGLGNFADDRDLDAIVDEAMAGQRGGGYN